MSAILGMNGKPLAVSEIAQRASTSHNVSASKGTRATVMRGRASSPNTAVSDELPTVRNRARDAVRNSPFVHNAIRSLVKHEVGTGITCRFLVEDDRIREQLQEQWAKSLPYLYADGIGHFHGAQRLASRGRNEGGEVFLRRRRRRNMNGLVPLQIQLLESDYLDITYNTTLNNGNVVRSGVEINSFGERVAYWFFTSHPDEKNVFGSSAPQRVRILAKDVSHHYVPLRAGQLRGMPISSPALFKNAQLEAYDDYELERKKKHAAFTGVIERDTIQDASGKLIDPLTNQPYDPETELPQINLATGNIVQLFDGERLNLFDAEKGGEFYADYMRQQLLSISASFGVPYELVTGDWKSVNDRLVRAILNDFQREVEAVQTIFIVNQVCYPTLAWWMDTGVLSGVLDLPDYANRRDEYLSVDWIPQGWAYVHPLQDVQAAVLRIENDLSTHEKEARKLSADSEKVLAANIKHAAKKKQLMEDNDLVAEETEETDNDEVS